MREGVAAGEGQDPRGAVVALGDSGAGRGSSERVAREEAGTDRDGGARQRRIVDVRDGERRIERHRGPLLRVADRRTGGHDGRRIGNIDRAGGDRTQRGAVARTPVDGAARVGAVRAARVGDARAVGHRVEHALIMREGVAAGEGQDPRGAVVARRDGGAGGGGRERVAREEAGTDRDGGARQRGVVDVGHGEAGVERHRGPLLGVADRRTGGHDGSGVGDGDRAGGDRTQRGAVARTPVDGAARVGAVRAARVGDARAVGHRVEHALIMREGVAAGEGQDPRACCCSSP